MTKTSRKTSRKPHVTKSTDLDRIQGVFSARNGLKYMFIQF